MQQVITSLLLIALGMAVDAWYQRKLRIAECNAYETGYQQGKHEERIKEESRNPQVLMSGGFKADEGVQNPSMAAPVKLPETFGERLKKHGQATVWMNKQGGTA